MQTKTDVLDLNGNFKGEHAGCRADVGGVSISALDVFRYDLSLSFYDFSAVNILHISPLSSCCPGGFHEIKTSHKKLSNDR